MAHANLTYDLNDKDDKEAFTVAAKSKELWLCLWDLDQYLRNLLDTEPPSVEEIRGQFWDVLQEHDVTLEELS
jgi:hypothetical protein